MYVAPHLCSRRPCVFQGKKVKKYKSKHAQQARHADDHINVSRCACATEPYFSRQNTAFNIFVWLVDWRYINVCKWDVPHRFMYWRCSFPSSEHRGGLNVARNTQETPSRVERLVSRWSDTRIRRIYLRHLNVALAKKKTGGVLSSWV